MLTSGIQRINAKPTLGKQTFCPAYKASPQGLDMQEAIRLSYASIRRRVQQATPIVLLHIGEDRTWLAA